MKLGEVEVSQHQGEFLKSSYHQGGLRQLGNAWPGSSCGVFGRGVGRMSVLGKPWEEGSSVEGQAAGWLPGAEAAWKGWEMALLTKGTSRVVAARRNWSRDLKMKMRQDRGKRYAAWLDLSPYEQSLSSPGQGTCCPSKLSPSFHFSPGSYVPFTFFLITLWNQFSWLKILEHL